MNRILLTTAILMITASLIQSCRTAKEAGPEDIVSSIEGAAAHWISADRLIWDSGPLAYRHEIRYSQKAAIRVDTQGVSGGEVIPVGSQTRLDSGLADRFRHISDRPVHRVDAGSDAVFEAVKGQVIAIAYDRRDQPVAATRVQFPGLIDEAFFYGGELGSVYREDTLSARLWAPTALSVKLKIYDADKKLVDTVLPDHLEEAAVTGQDGSEAAAETREDPPADRDAASAMVQPRDGVWRFSAARKDWDRKFYRYELSVYHPVNNRVNSYEVTDPYSVSLAMDSRYSQFADLDDDDLKPQCWGRLSKELPHPADITLYEAHIRDFSINDRSVPEEHRGTYMAFRHNGLLDRGLSDGMAHLKRLSEAGLTHLHLLPLNDIASIIENPERRVDLHMPYRRICDVLQHPGLFEQCERRQFIPIREAFEQMAEEDPATDLIQMPYSLPGRSRGLAAVDGFNWGYDPFHFNVPQGSYSTDPDGVTRIRELRAMVQSLAQIGLNVVVDVVYNHTFVSGPASRFSVLDRVVPGYYHRYDPDTGAMETSTCCDNTAAEHAMMEKLIIDSVLLWAQQYKIDSFRFDLMGHHPRAVMERVRDELAKLTLEEHQVDGDNIYIYGEGWNFGEVADDRLFDQATQFNMGGTGIGNCTDRSRAAIRGGNFTDNGRDQGFTSGRYLFPNEEAEPGREEDLDWLLDAADRIRVGMSGNLATYPYINREGKSAVGDDEKIGFALQPQESVNYIDKHDNETLWDNTQAKLPLDMPMPDRIRVHMLGNAFINFGQGVPFYQMGTDLLRSKSLDRNSFDSGDWFNAVDFSLESHLWAKGLPPAWDNEARWEDIRGLFRDADVDVRRGHMELAHKLFQEQLRIRYSSPLFRLRTAEEIHQRLAFHNTGPDQEPGIIAMTISDGTCTSESLDPNYDGILVIFNADNRMREIELALEGMSWDGLELHPVLQQGADTVVRETVRDGNQFRIPALTAAVFVMPQKAVQGDFICNQ
ncbi:MAG: pullulanase-type alpha-1,6-glucosidase [Bacteroidota bacterium]